MQPEVRCPRRLARALAALAWLPLACGPASEEPAARSAVLITLDTTRADALGCFGGRAGLTPHLDRLARESLAFDRAHTVAPITLPSHASMLTGLYPIRHTVRDNGLRPVPQSARTLAERARAEGFQTAAFIAAVVLDKSFGLDQGFEVYDVPTQAGMTASSHFADRPASEVVERALAWLRVRDRQRPFLLWVHLFDPHAPYEPPPEFRGGSAAGNLYLGEVAAMDHEIGRLLDELRSEELLERATVLVVADHGEAFGEHGEQSHATYCYQTTLRVPLLLRHADGHRAGERSRALTSVVDVYPTLVDAMGLAPDDALGELDGESLFEREPAADRGVYFESYNGYFYYGWSPIAGWLDARGKYVHSTQPQLFDPWEDPAEEVDRIDMAGAELSRYRNAIERVARLPALETSATSGADEELLRRIRALGYVAAGEGDDEGLPHPLAPGERLAPAQTTQLHATLMTASAEMNRGQWARASERFAEVLRQDPGNDHARGMLGACLIQTRSWAEAVPVFQRLVAGGRASASIYYNLAISLMQTDRSEEAIAAFQTAHDLAPEQAQILQYLVQLLRGAGRADEAAEYETRLRKLRSSS